MYTEIMLIFSFVPVVIQQNYSVFRAKRKEKISVCRAEACPRGRKNGMENKKALKTQCFQGFLMAERVGFELDFACKTQ